MVAGVEILHTESIPLARFEGQQLHKICKDTLATAGDVSLLSNIQNTYPEYPFRLARLGHEWYRLGGVIKADGTRIAADVNEWAERTFIECGQDFNTLLDYC